MNRFLHTLIRPVSSPFVIALVLAGLAVSLARAQATPPRKQAAVNAIDKVALNPQPLPPRILAGQAAAVKVFNKVALNPQPLPPRIFAGQSAAVAKFSASKLSTVAIHPEPKRHKPRFPFQANRLGVGTLPPLNRQPLSPLRR